MIVSFVKPPVVEELDRIGSFENKKRISVKGEVTTDGLIPTRRRNLFRRRGRRAAALLARHQIREWYKRNSPIQQSSEENPSNRSDTGDPPNQNVVYKEMRNGLKYMAGLGIKPGTPATLVRSCTYH
uniref:Uncharacterized protein n=1 Tax=Magallana gigas TaxID=29159 RepID=K1RAA2_MAGGI